MTDNAPMDTARRTSVRQSSPLCVCGHRQAHHDQYVAPTYDEGATWMCSAIMANDHECYCLDYTPDPFDLGAE